MEKNLPKGLNVQSVPGRMSCNRKKLIQTNTFDSEGSFLQTLIGEKSNCVVCEHLCPIPQRLVVSSHSNRANGCVYVSVVAAWQG